MADVNISKYRASVVRDGSKPASPGFVVSEGQDPVNPPGTNNFVPYTGATANVELGEFGVEAGFVTLDTTPTNIPTDQGAIYWDDTRSTAALIMNGTLQHIGQDSFFYVKNSSGSTIPKGTCVGFAGTDGGSGHLLVTPFLANGSVPSTYFMGVTCESIANGSFGQVMHFGELEGINTSGFTAGALLYASSTVAGAFQTTAPVAPNNIILVAAAVNSKNNGAIVVRPTLGSNFGTNESVKLTSVTDKDLLQYTVTAGVGLWENKTLSQVIGSAYVPSTRTLTINGTTQDLSADRTFNVGTVTSVGLSSATSGVTIGSTPVTSSGTITLAIATASGSQQGLLSASDWTTFNNKQNALTNPVTGTGTTNYLAKFTGSTTVGNSQIFDNGTNVGINQAVPLAKFDILQTSSSLGGWFMTSQFSATNYPMIILGAITPNKYSRIGNDGDGSFAFFTNGSSSSLGTQSMTLTSGGNLLVGTTSDNGERLQVNGEITAVTRIRINKTTQSNQIFGDGNAFNISGSNNLGIRNDSGSIVFASGGANVQLILNTSGNVGIGTASPNQALTVIGNVRAGGVGNGLLLDTLGVEFTNGVKVVNNFETVVFSGRGSAGYLIAGDNSLRFGFGVNYTSGQIMTINTSGNVLIGTTTDNGARLQVSGEGRFTNSDGADLIRYAATGVNTNFATKIVSGANDVLVFRRQHVSVGGLDIMALGFNGNVGIGTSSPNGLWSGDNRTLNILSPANFSSELVLSRTAGSVAAVSVSNFLSGTTADFGIYTTAALNYVVYTNNNERIRVTSGGSLLVNRTTNVSDTYKFIVRNSTDVNIGFGILGGEATIESFNDAINLGTPLRIYATKLSLGLTGNVLIGSTSDPGYKLFVNGNTYIRSGGNTSGSFGLVLQDSSANNLFLVRNDGASTFVGSVGIGTFSPSQALDVYRDSSVASYVVARNGSGVQTAIGVAGDNGSLLGTLSNHNLRIVTNGAVVATITNGGNVGIGTATFAYSPRLAVASVGQNSIAIQTTDTVQGSAGTILYLGTGASTGNSTFGIIRALGNGGTGATNLVLQESGNVLIGTTTDNGARLQVNGAIYASDELYLDNGKYLRFRRSSGNLSIQTLGIPSGTDDVRLLTTGDFNVLNGSLTNLMTVKNNGNVGIGTTSPQKPLEVFSNANDFVSVGVAPLGVGQWAGIHFGYRENNTSYRKSAIVFERTDLTANDAQGRIHILNGPQASAGSATLSNARLTIAENGNVLINTLTDVGARLHVNGDVRTAAPTGGSAVNWRLGTVRGGTITPNATVRVEIGGVLVDLDARYV